MTKSETANFLSGLLPTHAQSDDIFAFSWSDIATTATILPQLEVQALELIDNLLGYRPHRSVTLPYEISLRGLVSSFRYGLLDEEEFLRQAEGSVKLIRNEDLESDSSLEYNESIYDRYWKTFDPYGFLAKSRVTFILGHEPELKHSVAAELWLRDVMALDTMVLPNELTPADYKVLTVIRYRQVLLEEGKVAADTSPLRC